LLHGTNYGLGSAIVEAKDRESCINICESSTTIWPGYDIDEIITTGKEGILFQDAS
jgi:hypothetical protein